MKTVDKKPLVPKVRQGGSHLHVTQQTPMSTRAGAHILSSATGARAAVLSQSPHHSTASAEPPASAEDPKKTTLALKRINCRVASNMPKKSNLSLAWLPYPTKAIAFIYRVRWLRKEAGDVLGRVLSWFH